MRARCLHACTSRSAGLLHARAPHAHRPRPARTAPRRAALHRSFLVITTTDNLSVFAAFQAVAFGCAIAAVLWNYVFLRSRVAELRLSVAMMWLSSWPFFFFLKAIVLVAFSKSQLLPGQANTAAMLGVCALLDVVMGGRSSIVGLAGFVTLPSREVVSIWQIAAILLGTGAAARVARRCC